MFKNISLAIIMAAMLCTAFTGCADQASKSKSSEVLIPDDQIFFEGNDEFDDTEFTGSYAADDSGNYFDGDISVCSSKC